MLPSPERAFLLEEVKRDLRVDLTKIGIKARGVNESRGFMYGSMYRVNNSRAGFNGSGCINHMQPDTNTADQALCVFTPFSAPDFFIAPDSKKQKNNTNNIIVDVNSKTPCLTQRHPNPEVINGRKQILTAL